jgi:pSer/pThr/pTyr-binding forkhead associated (FHA) protein
MAYLEVTSGEQIGICFRLAERPIIGGRDPAAEIQLLDPLVSRRHFQILPRSGQYGIRELRSRNGVWVNDLPILGISPLRDGDRVRIGDTSMLFHASELTGRPDALQSHRDASTRARERGTESDDD